MWMLPLYLHFNQKSDYDDYDYFAIIFAITDVKLSSLYFQFQFWMNIKMCMIANELGHGTSRSYTT